MIRWLAWCLLPLCVACGTEPVPDRKDCALTIKMTGAVERDLDGPQPCSLITSSDPNPPTFTSYVELGESYHLSITLADLTEGATGQFVADLGVLQQPGPSAWGNPLGSCTVQLSDHSVFDKNHGDAWLYRLTGSGSCTQPATGLNADSPGSIEFSDFSFKTLVGWKQ